MADKPTSNQPLPSYGGEANQNEDIILVPAEETSIVSGFSTPSAENISPGIDLGEDLMLREPLTLGEKSREIGYGLTAGGIQGLTASELALAGAKYAGRAAFTATPPMLPIVGPLAKPIAGVIGATGGFLTGLTAGSLLTNDVDKLFPELTREDLAPYREGGRTWGITIGSAPAAFRIPVMQGNRVATFISNMGETARKNPKVFMATETLGGITTGIAGGVSEAYYPGEWGPRAGAELATGIFSPTRLLSASVGPLTDFTKQIGSSFSKGSRESRAADALAKILADVGEDIPTLIKRLEAPLPFAATEAGTPSAAQKTGSVGLSILETTLARGSSKYNAELIKQGEGAFKAYTALVAKLRSIGDPASLVKAAELDESRFTEMLSGRFDQANKTAAEKIFKITQDTPQARADIGQIIQSETKRALADARQHEKMLWDEAYKSSLVKKTVNGKSVLVPREINPSKMAEAYLDIATSITPERLKSRLGDINSIMSRLGLDKEAIARYAAGKRTQQYLETGIVPKEYLTVLKDGKPVSAFKNTNVQDLINIRSDMLAFAREAAAKGETANAGFYGRIAESALDDLSSINNPSYDSARIFSRSLNDFFTRTYANEISAVTKKGGLKLPAEVLVAKAFGSANDVTALRMADMEDAIGMMGKQYDDAVAKFGANSPEAIALKPYSDASKQGVVSIRDAQSRILRLEASKLIDPQTGRVNATRLMRFVDQNKGMLDRLGLTDDLTDITKAETLLKAVEDENSVLMKSVKDQEAFARVLSVESPSIAIADSLNSDFPVKNFSKIVRLAKDDGPAAVAGLKSTVYDYLFTKAGGDKFSPQAFNDALFKPIAYNQPSVANILRSQGVMTLSEVKNIRKLLNPMANIETAIKNNQLSDDIVNGADFLVEFALRTSGARLGTKLTTQNNLIAAHAGSRYMREQFDKLPTVLVKQILQEATQDPQYMALLLKRGVNPREKYQISKALVPFLARSAYGGRAAILNSMDFEPSVYQEETPAPRARKLFQSLPTAPTRGTKTTAPNVGSPFQGGTSLTPVPAPKGPAPTPSDQQSTSRKMLQSLFPMDTISSMGAE